MKKVIILSFVLVNTFFAAFSQNDKFNAAMGSTLQQLGTAKTQEEMALKEFSGSSGGDAVKVTVTGGQKIISVTVKKDVMAAGDVEMLQDLIVTATNDALTAAKEATDKEMAKITGGMGMPGMF